AEGQDVAEWLKAQGGVLGIPEKPEGYEVKKPDLPDGVSWDDGLEAKWREKAHAAGMLPHQMQAGVELMAEVQTGLLNDARADLQNATQEMRQALERDWGDQYGAKVELAKQAAAAAFQAAGLDGEEQLAVAQMLKPKVGDPGIMRLFAALGAMMGEDSLAQGGKGGAGAGGMAMTPQEAKAELDRFTGPDGEYGRAMKDKNQKALNELNPRRLQLIKLMSSG
ncbi:MAG: hypothetical protein AAF899_09670, partial [Pseudomonadota bacterium]